MKNKSNEKKVFKLFFDWEFEELELWLNEMAAEGWALKKPGMVYYYFERCEPGEYTVRLEMRDEGRKEYIKFMQENGAEYLDGPDFMWLYFRKKTADGPFELFSDLDSKIAHLNRIGNALFAVGILNVIVGVYNTFSLSSAQSRWVLLLPLINLLIAMPLMYGLGRIHGKRSELEKERKLHE